MPDTNTEDIDPTHALVQIAAHNRQARALGATRDPCPSCHTFLRRYARYHNNSIAVSAPLQDYVYRKNGTLLLIDREARIPIAQAYTPPLATTTLMRQLQTRLQTNESVTTLPTLIRGGMYRPAHAHEVKRAEQILGFSIPKVLQQLYTEVANGGFGPGYGLIGLDTGMYDYTGLSLAQVYLQARQPDPQASSAVWPASLLLLCHWGCGIYSCVDCSTPDLPVIRFDPNKLGSESQQGRAFFPEAASLMMWMTRWVNAEDLWGSFEGQ